MEDGKKTLVISFGGALDLYWSIISVDRNNDNNMDNDSEIRCESFLITKENYLIMIRKRLLGIVMRFRMRLEIMLR